MDIRKCSRCGKLFNILVPGEIFCPDCKKKSEEEFRIVKNFVWDHPGVTIHQVSEETGVDKKYIKQWLREDRLQLSDDAVDLELTCERCGKPITSGRYCPECRVANLHAVQEMAPKPTATVVQKPMTGGPSKMRFLGK